MSIVLAGLAFFLLAGCQVERIVLEEPVTSRFVEVCTDDLVLVRLDDNGPSDYCWTAKCSDPLVDIVIESEREAASGGPRDEPSRTDVRILVGRGFQGTVPVYLRYERCSTGECARRITLQLHRRPTDLAVWR